MEKLQLLVVIAALRRPAFAVNCTFFALQSHMVSLLQQTSGRSQCSLYLVARRRHNKRNRDGNRFVKK